MHWPGAFGKAELPLVALETWGGIGAGDNSITAGRVGVDRECGLGKVSVAPKPRRFFLCLLPALFRLAPKFHALGVVGGIFGFGFSIAF